MGGGAEGKGGVGEGERSYLLRDHANRLYPRWWKGGDTSSPGPYLYIKFEYEADKEEMIYLFSRILWLSINLTISRLLEKNT